MSLASTIQQLTKSKFVIPVEGKMFHSNLTKKNKALCFCLNKGYFETSDLANLCTIIDTIKDRHDKDFVWVGQIEKYLLSDKKTIVYRQRVFFHSLAFLLDILEEFSIQLEIPESFHVRINSVLNVLSDLPYLERYAKGFHESIDDYLTHTLLSVLELICNQKHVLYNFNVDMYELLKNKQGYLDRAPLLISSYYISEKKSGVFTFENINDERLFSTVVTADNFDTFGYTTVNIEYDIKKKVLL